MRKVLPLLLALFGLAAGGGAGYIVRPPAEETVNINPCGEEEMARSSAGGHSDLDDGAADTSAYEYVKLNNQFVVPVVEQGDVAALVILSMSLEVAAGHSEDVYAVEPKLRDAFLRVLFDHANTGGFEGAFTQSSKMDVLRSSLLETARRTLGSSINSVLIENIVRQDG
ncbi:hypothetical protein DEA8626_02503 [Defluviimonas aquaemixtae]|uniref:Flagellar protein FliL n=1 Tax=Albidovulum aquaemixtae TaxID=1542388 RepID=A0A2R8BJ54_9RHOB|nr:flagellar basal body-associated FliL family protein [Defluviimonas aquaemixtae]SPH23440.1 hypothetical protein DEA8626_02503 [Defluviimonas aquaemixtae]